METQLTPGEARPSLKFRRAREDEVAALSALAWAAKAHWGYPAAWLEAWRPHLTVTAQTLAAEHVVVAERLESGSPPTGEGAVVGFFSLRKEAGAWRLEHCWVAPSEMGRGCGRLMWGEAVRRARILGARELLISSDPGAEGFYRKMGAERVSVERYYLFGTVLRELPQLRVKL